MVVWNLRIRNKLDGRIVSDEYYNDPGLAREVEEIFEDSTYFDVTVTAVSAK